MDWVLTFPPYLYIRKLILFRTLHKTYFIFITFNTYHRTVVKQNNNVYEKFVELWKHRFVMQSLQNPLLCSSTVRTADYAANIVNQLALRAPREFCTQVGPYQKCCHVQTRAHGHVLSVSLNVGICHRRIYLMFTDHWDQVNCMYRQFSAYTQLLCSLNFSIRNLS